MKHVLIYGPGGCGKTRHKDALAKAFRCEAIIDGETLGVIKHLANGAKTRTLFLTNHAPAQDDHAAARRVDVYSFSDAMGLAGLAS